MCVSLEPKRQQNYNSQQAKGPSKHRYFFFSSADRTKKGSHNLMPSRCFSLQARHCTSLGWWWWRRNDFLKIQIPEFMSHQTKSRQSTQFPPTYRLIFGLIRWSVCACDHFTKTRGTCTPRCGWSTTSYHPLPLTILALNNGSCSPRCLHWVHSRSCMLPRYDCRWKRIQKPTSVQY